MTNGHLFPFETGDTVLVNTRNDEGSMNGKFVAECTGIEVSGPTSGTARFKLPFGLLNHLTVRSYEAEFEKVEDASEVSF